MKRRTLLRAATAVALAMSLGGTAAAQTVDPSANWPSKPVRLIVNFGPGGSADNSTRPYAERLSRSLGQQFVIENRGGASGSLGLEAAMKAPPDGYTFVVTPALSMVILPHLRKTPYDPLKDLVPVSRFTIGTLLFAVHPSVPANSIAEVVTYAKANPGKLSWGTAGFGSHGHMLCEIFKQKAGVDILHVPYRGGGESLSDFLAGVVQIHADPNTMPHVTAGKAKLLAVIDQQRVAAFPDVPMMKEIYPEIDFVAWFGVYAPAGTPPAIVNKMSEALATISRDPEMKPYLAKFALAPNPGTPDDLAEATRVDYARYGKLVKELNLRMD
ncbi:MAG: tripartite tricarboxylate transporter substrate binding protein [Acetobacteraceae bacterium]|nr:tripartite tricarboxylate transporter substrate binding protein [Pseudomonadota bacterium]